MICPIHGISEMECSCPQWHGAIGRGGNCILPAGHEGPCSSGDPNIGVGGGGHGWGGAGGPTRLIPAPNGAPRPTLSISVSGSKPVTIPISRLPREGEVITVTMEGPDGKTVTDIKITTPEGEKDQ